MFLIKLFVQLYTCVVEKKGNTEQITIAVCRLQGNSQV